jgi:D-alanine-D-alanine ligase-like ATP-grasp enzyme
MTINQTANEVLADALKQLSASSLLQIAKHCDRSIDLARSFNSDFKEHKALIEDERHDTLRQLAAYCYKAIELQTKAAIEYMINPKVDNE